MITAQEAQPTGKKALTFKMLSIADSVPSMGSPQLTVHEYLASNGQYLSVAYYFFPSPEEAQDAFTGRIRDADKVLEYRPATQDQTERAILLNKVKVQDQNQPGACFLTISKATLRDICSESLEVTLAFVGPNALTGPRPTIIPYRLPDASVASPRVLEPSMPTGTIR